MCPPHVYLPLPYPHWIFFITNTFWRRCFYIFHMFHIGCFHNMACAFSGQEDATKTTIRYWKYVVKIRTVFVFWRLTTYCFYGYLCISHKKLYLCPSSFRMKNKLFVPVISLWLGLFLSWTQPLYVNHKRPLLENEYGLRILLSFFRLEFWHHPYNWFFPESKFENLQTLRHWKNSFYSSY